jgi:antitoxin (DNA-binding transcriptional repressor) of toxin-antitoxin stability system
MARLKTVGVKELKNNLSAYLREVRRGTRILVSDRNTVVAELHEPRPGYQTDEVVDPLLAEWVDDGIVALPNRRKQKLDTSPLKSERGTGQRLLDQDRSEDRG